MKKLSILAVVVCTCMLATAATATAKKASYSGPINPSGTLSFKLKTSKGKADVMKLSWDALPVNCGGTPNTTSGTLTFAVPVKNKAFKARAVLGEPKAPKAEAKIDGKFKGKSASGSITLTGSELPIDSGGAADCASGKLTWSATS